MKTFMEWMRTEATQPHNEKILILMRGFPGSGKSTKVAQLLAKHGGSDGHVVSIDHRWMPDTRKRRVSGDYVSPEEEHEEYIRNHPGPDQSKMMSAIKQTHQEFFQLVDNGVTPIIVDDTNIQKEFMRPYADYADKAGYEITVATPETPWWKEFEARLNMEPSERGDDFEQMVKDMNARGNRGGRRDVPLAVTQGWASKWSRNPTTADILGREPTSKRS